MYIWSPPPHRPTFLRHSRGLVVGGLGKCFLEHALHRDSSGEGQGEVLRKLISILAKGSLVIKLLLNPYKERKA